MTNTEAPVLLTTKRAAKRLGLSKWSVYRWVKRGWLEAIELPNGYIRITEASVNKALAGKK